MGSKGKQNCELSHIDWTHKDPKVYMQIQIFQFRKMLRVVGLDCSNESLDLILDLSVAVHGSVRKRVLHGGLDCLDGQMRANHFI